jgi:hypothetical protein
MDGIGSNRLRRDSVNGARAELSSEAVEAAPEAHPVADAVATPSVISPVRAGSSVSTAALLVVMTFGMVTVTAVCLAVAGLALALWPPALIDAVLDGRLGDRALALAAGAGTPIVLFVLVDLSWRAFARGRSRRCADLMIAAAAMALVVHGAVFGFTISG